MSDKQEGERFDIMFRGDIVLGFELSKVKASLAHLFKADERKIAALFTGKPVALKRNVDALTAKKYQTVLQKAGAEVSVVATGANTAPKPAVRGLSLAPVGVNLLRPQERLQIAPVAVDTSELSLRPVAGNLLDSGELPVPDVTPVAVPALNVAEAGEPLLRAEDKNELPVAEIAVEGWALAEVGADLLSPQERPTTAAVAVADLATDLAPAGSDLGQITDKRKPVQVDISGLQLAEPD